MFHWHVFVSVLSVSISVFINLMAVQEGPTSIRVSWSPPTPLGDTTGYRIYYSGGSSGSENVSGGSTDNYLLTGLQNGESYNISIVSVSQHSTSNAAIVLDITLGKNDLLYSGNYHMYVQFISLQSMPQASLVSE